MKQKKYWEMTTDELAEATKCYDRENIVDESRPPTPEEAEQLRRAMKKRGRPQVGKGYQRISVSIERSLLSRVNSFAKRKKLSRSKLLAEVLRRAMEKDPPL